MVFQDIQSLEGARACLSTFFNVLLETNIKLQDCETELYNKQSDLEVCYHNIEEMQSQIN